MAIGIHAYGSDCQGNGRPVIFGDGQNPNAAAGNGTVFSPYQRFSEAVINTLAGGCPASPAIVSVANGHYEGFSFALTNACPFQARRFFWFDLNRPPPIPLRNP